VPKPNEGSTVISLQHLFGTVDNKGEINSLWLEEVIASKTDAEKAIQGF